MTNNSHLSVKTRFSMACLRRRGVALMLVLVAVVVCSTIAYSYIGTQGTSVTIARNIRDHTQARYVAETGLEAAVAYIERNDNWRKDKTPGTWVTNAPFGGGVFTIVVEDGRDLDGDGHVDGDGDLLNNPTDLATVTVTARCGNGAHVTRVVLEPHGRFLHRDVELADVPASFWGQAAYNYSGISVSGAGDVNGDGYRDLLIGAQGNSEGGSYAGKAYLVFGKDRYQAGSWLQDRSLANAEASFIGEAASHYAGSCVAKAGDVNKDGYDDVLISAYYSSTGGSGAGEVYLILGKPGGWTRNLRLNNANASFLGEATYNYAGYSATGVGDVNGDGYADFVIGAYGNGQGGMYAGKTYLILGKPAGWAMRTNLSLADASFIGLGVIHLSGFCVSPASDVNGDGLADFLIGAYLSSRGGTYAGEVYLIFGKKEGWQRNVPLSAANASFVGEATYNYVGFSVAGVGDVNGDSFADFVVGAYNNAQGGSMAGKTYLVLGKASGWTMLTSLANANASFIGEAALDRSGYRVAAAGDLNHDGLADFLIGAPFRYKPKDGYAQQGQAYLVFGRDSGWEKNVSLLQADGSYWGAATYNLAGYALKGVGDVDGDGIDDLAVTSYYSSEPASYAGQTYLMQCGLTDYDADWATPP